MLIYIKRFLETVENLFVSCTKIMKFNLIDVQGRRDETMLVNMTAVQIDVGDLYEGGTACCSQSIIIFLRIIYNQTVEFLLRSSDRWN